MELELVFYNDDFKQQLDNYTITDDQLRFTGHPDEAIALAKDDPERHPVVAVRHNMITNFFVLHEKNGARPYTSHPHAILLRTFSTDFHQQGKGYARQCLKQLPHFVRTHFPEIEQMVLGVNTENVAAQNLYRQAGFVDEGGRMFGKKGELIIMHYHLGKEGIYRWK
ncbi:MULTISPECIES: GNAT family N-acetyltransferase [unclassified Heyndrickxia]|uniref:GNAT family N-acetyltransferase n=1 Tax=unclassified Heyndrickxia TaxID=2837518 RepID=UPI0030FD16E8